MADVLLACRLLSPVPGSELYGARQAGTPAVRGHGTAAGHSHPAPNDIDPQGPGRSGRDAIGPGPGLGRAA